MDEINNKDRYYSLILIGGILAILIAPWLFTSQAFWNRLDFSKTGTIGDTIGGITAPISGLIGAILVYWSFKEQRKANIIQWSAFNNELKVIKQQNKFDFFLRLFDEIKIAEKENREILEEWKTNIIEYVHSDGKYKNKLRMDEDIYSFMELNSFFIKQLLNSDLEVDKIKFLGIIFYNFYSAKVISKVSISMGDIYYSGVQKLMPFYFKKMLGWKLDFEKLINYVQSK